MSSNPWSDDIFPPLDIDRVARVLAIEFGRAFDDGVRRAIQDVQTFGEAHPTVAVRESEAVYAKIVEVLKAYDYGRTQHIKFLTGELRNMHNLLMPSIATPSGGQ